MGVNGAPTTPPLPHPQRARPAAGCRLTAPRTHAPRRRRQDHHHRQARAQVHLRRGLRSRGARPAPAPPPRRAPPPRLTARMRAKRAGTPLKAPPAPTPNRRSRVTPSAPPPGSSCRSGPTAPGPNSTRRGPSPAQPRAPRPPGPVACRAPSARRPAPPSRCGCQPPGHAPPRSGAGGDAAAHGHVHSGGQRRVREGGGRPDPRGHLRAPPHERQPHGGACSPSLARPCAARQLSSRPAAPG